MKFRIVRKKIDVLCDPSKYFVIQKYKSFFLVCSIGGVINVAGKLSIKFSVWIQFGVHTIFQDLKMPKGILDIF